MAGFTHNVNGDFNGDNAVNSADYILWQVGATGHGGDDDNDYGDQDDYDLMMEHFGETLTLIDVG